MIFAPNRVARWVSQARGPRSEAGIALPGVKSDAIEEHNNHNMESEEQEAIPPVPYGCLRDTWKHLPFIQPLV